MLLESATNTSKITGLSEFYKNPGIDNENGDLYSIFGKDLELYGDSEVDAKMGTIIAPQVSTIDDLKVFGTTKKEINNNEEIIIPINIYWLFKSHDIRASININSIGYEEHNKKLKVRLHPTSIDKPFDFILAFNIKNKRL